MLQLIRDRLTGWFAIFILGAIALTLVLTFGNIDTGFSAGGTAASVNGDDIPMQDFRRIYQRQRQQWETTYRAQIPDALAEDVADQVIQSLVRNRVVSQHVDKQGYRVSDATMIEAIEATPAFQVGGLFSRPSYEALLAAEGISPARYEYEQRQDMQVTQFIEGLGYTAFYTPSEFRRYIELDGETRDVEFVLLSAANWQDGVELTQEDVSDYYDSNKPGFMTEESVALEYVEVDYAEILASIAITEEETQAYFDANPQEFSGPDERQAAHILILDEDDATAAARKAEELKLRLEAGESFADLAAQYSADTGSAGNGGDLGWLGIGDSPAPEFEAALFALQPGGTSEPVQTPFGYHLIKLLAVRDGKSRDYEEVRDELTERLRENAAAELFAERVDELDERALESLDGLAGVAEALGEELQTIERYTRTGGEPLGFNPELVSTVYSLEVLEDGENSPVVEVAEGRAVVVRVTEHRPSKVKPLEDVRSEIVTQLRNEESISLAMLAGSGAVSSLNAGANLAELDLPGVTKLEQAQGVRRGSTEFPTDLSAAVFRAPTGIDGEGGEYQGLLLASGDFAIYRVVASRPGNPEDYSPEDRSTRKQQLAGRLGGAQATALVETLVQSASVSVAPDLLSLENNL